MSQQKKKKRDEADKIEVSENAEVQIFGPFTNEYPKNSGIFKRSVLIKTDKYTAFVDEKDLEYDIEDDEDKSFKNKKDKLREIVFQPHLIKWMKNKVKQGDLLAGDLKEFNKNFAEFLFYYKKSIIHGKVCSAEEVQANDDEMD